MIQNINKKNKGFGIIEVLVASAVIVVILAALVGMGRLSLSNSVKIQERAQGTGLAQEGMEIVRQIRDTNWVDGDNTTAWDSLSFDGTAWTKITPGNYAILYNPVIDRYYLSSGATETIKVDNVDFSRQIIVSTVSNLILANSPSPTLANYALKITSEVTIPGGSKISVSEMITNWRPNY